MWNQAQYCIVPGGAGQSCTPTFTQRGLKLICTRMWGGRPRPLSDPQVACWQHEQFLESRLAA